jgi:type VI secretion system secreted protein Hcp
MDIDKEGKPSRAGRQLVVGALAAAATLAAGNATAAIDMFLKISDIPGESQDAKHAKEIDVLAWSWGLAGPVGGKKVQAGCTQQLSLTKWVDAATPTLASHAVLGQPSASAKLTVRKEGKETIDVLVVTFDNLTPTSTSTGGSGGEDRLTENVTFAFTTATLTYTPQKPDGTAGTAVTATLPGTCP